jgi:hypothetical protein
LGNIEAAGVVAGANVHFPLLAEVVPRLPRVHIQWSSDYAGHFYFFFPDARVGCHAAAFWLGAAAIILIFSFFGFLASRLLLCWPLAMSISLALMTTQTTHRPAGKMHRDRI